MLPERPNGSTGWVRRADVTTDVDRYRIVVSLRAHRLSACDGDRVLLQVPAAVGTSATPTPTGRFYTTELLRPPNPTGPYGPMRSDCRPTPRSSPTSPVATAPSGSMAPTTCRRSGPP